MKSFQDRFAFAGLVAGIVVLLLGITSCKDSREVEASEYFAYVSEPDNGLFKKKRIGAIEVAVKYLSGDYLALQYVQSLDQGVEVDLDSIRQSYESGVCFMLSIGPTEDSQKKSGDIMLSGITTYPEYLNRTMAMNFDIKDLVEIQVAGQTYKPLIATLENTYGIREGRNIILLFERPDIESEEETLRFTYDDRIFDSGICNFVFKFSDMARAPRIKI